MSCLMTSATRRSRSVPAAVLIASAAASSHEVLLVPMISVTLYTLMTISFDRGPAPSPCGQPFTEPVVDAAGDWSVAGSLGEQGAIGDGERHQRDAHADHDPGDEVDAAVGDAGVEDDAGDGGGGNGADVAEGARQSRGGAELLGGCLGVQGGLVAGGAEGRADAEDDRDDDDHADPDGAAEQQDAGRGDQAGERCRDDGA